MSGIQLRLQRELFDPAGEQLLSMVQCVSGKKGKRRDIYVCLLNETRGTQTFNITLSELRSNPDRPSDLPKKKRSWPLRDLKAIDAKHSSEEGGGGSNKQPSLLINEIPEGMIPDSLSFFELEFDRPYAWIAVNDEERKKFLSTLINVSARHSGHHGGQGQQRPRLSLTNLPPDVIVVEETESGPRRSLSSEPNGEAVQNWPIFSKEDEEGYEAIGAKEGKDLMQLMSKCEHAVTNADIFVEDLTRQLSALDDSNISSILQSEENIDRLMNMLESALQHTEVIEGRLNQYDEFLEHIRDSMDKMEGKTVSIETVNANNKKLLDTLESVIRQLDLPYKYQNALNEADFTQSRKLRESILAAKALQKALNADIDPSLLQMKAVQDQRKRAERLKDKFSKAIHRHLGNLFIHMGNDTDNLDAGSGQLKLTRRKHLHKDLMKYSELVHWMKEMDEKTFVNLQTVYRQNLSKLYEKDIRKFFDLARHRISGGKPPTVVAGSSTDLSGGKKGKSGGGSGVGGAGLLGSDADSIHSNLSLSERERFDDVMETVLVELEDICMDEQFFSIHFFQMDQIDKNADPPDPKRDKRVMEAARSMMSEMFPSLENELLHFISFYERADAFFTLHALVRLGRHVLSTQDTGSFLAISFGTVLVQIKRNFDKFMMLQVKSVEEAKAPRKPKCGILPFVVNFGKFVDTTENIFKGSERRSDLEKWYTMIINEMVSAIVRISREHAKTPQEVTKMENFHHLHSLLASKKIAALESQKKEIRQKYNEALSVYVIQYFGRPLEKLNIFFDEIQQLIASGIKESEISYQLDYSKQKLRAVISIYPGREVRKGLDSLYKKVERHLSEEESLIQVVWRAMQEEFIRQYKNVEDLIQRCYPGAQIALDFTINEVLEYFSDIARSH